MDLFCPQCGEPVDNDELHDVEGKTYTQAAADFRADGCAALGYKHNEAVQPDRAVAAQAMYELLGDDMDGAASMLEDLGV